MLIQGRLDAGMRPAVDTEGFVGHQVLRWGEVGVGLRGSWLKRSIFHKDARARVFLPVKRVHVFLSAFLRGSRSSLAHIGDAHPLAFQTHQGLLAVRVGWCQASL